jgi:hypothetical protein
LSWQ